MKTDSLPLTIAGRQYATAYAAHYSAKDLDTALSLYRKIMATQSNTPEAKYAQSQILNIVKSVVPNQVILDSLSELALGHINHDKSPDLEPLTATPEPSEIATPPRTTGPTQEAKQ